MASTDDCYTAASRVRGAASPCTDLLPPGAKRLKHGSLAPNTVNKGDAAVGEVDAAEQTGSTDGTALVPHPLSAEGSMKVQLNDRTPNGAGSDQATSSADALASRLVCVLARCSSFSVASGQLLDGKYFTLGMLKSVDGTIANVWKAQRADLPDGTELKPKSYAWLAAHMMGDPFLPSEKAVNLGKAMQTRAAALKLEEKSERDRSSGERRVAQAAAEQGSTEQSVDDARTAINRRLQARLDVLLATPYPAYAKAYSLQAAAAMDTSLTADTALVAIATDTIAATGISAPAPAVEVPAECRPEPLLEQPVQRMRSPNQDDFLAGYAAAEEQCERMLAISEKVGARMKCNYDAEIALKQTEAYADADRAEKRGECNGALEVLTEFEHHLDEVEQRIGRQVAGAFLPLKVWVQQRKEQLQFKVEEEYSAEARMARLDDSLAKVNAIWWPNGYLQ